MIRTPRALIRYLEQTPERGLISRREGGATSRSEPSPAEVPDRHELVHEIERGARAARYQRLRFQSADEVTPAGEIFALALAVVQAWKRETMRVRGRRALASIQSTRRAAHAWDE